ncbi:MAG: carbohydrate kinase family protein [Candidatus Saccharibacteria bacterium]|nr:carbohydrate kinase family protein [Candidatus Saccharibacteria bacterium]
MARIVSLGAALQDVYLIDHDDLTPITISGSTVLGKVTVGSKVDIDKISYNVGGGGVNSAITFARHGHEAIFLGNISRDPAGSLIIKTLDREGVDNSYVNFLERKATGVSIILLDTKTGERTILTHRGASEQFGNFSEDNLDLIQPDWLYVTTLRGDLDTLTRFFKKAQSIGTKIMFNPGVKELEQPEKILKLLKYVDILNVNKLEAARLVPGTVLVELFYHLNGYVRTVLITDGAMGGIAGNGEEVFRFGIYEDTKVKDSTGAGDAFGSGFLAHITTGHSFKQSLIFASANSTSVVSKIGASKGILTGTEDLHPMPIQKI